MIKPQFLRILLLLVTLGSSLTGCRNKGTKQKSPEIAVANSYLHAVVKDLCGDKQQILSLLCLPVPTPRLDILRIPRFIQSFLST